MLTLAYSLSVLLMILLPVALAAWLRRRYPVAWLLFSIGSLTFIVSQVVHLPLNSWLTAIGWLSPTPFSDPSPWRSAILLGLTAGLCEELARAAGYAALSRFKPGWLRLPDSLMLGLGHGGFESMVIGGVLSAATVSSLLSIQNMDLSQIGLTPDQLAALQLQLDAFLRSPLAAVYPLLERMLAISAHVTFSLMVWRAFAGGRLRRDWYYIPLAVIYHALLDAVAVWAAVTLAGRTALSLLSFSVVLVPGWIWALWTARRIRPSPRSLATLPHAARSDASLRSELGVFRVALSKELRQLWQTRRALVVWAVFLIFGMGSPLMAKLVPQMLGSLEGAEMFADLIPTPTAADAMTQYLKNLSQFGFLLAVLLGMGAIVGEKERGTAAMIISKPMPRWAFISSKFCAQMLMYLAGFILAGVGAYYYTLILFGSLAAGPFAALNGLLFLWLLAFVGVSLLASTLATSTVAAGGIGLAISVALMLAGSLPRYGALLPGGLMGWAAQLGQIAAGVELELEAAGPMAGVLISNGGAIAGTLVTILLALVLSLGIFEQQEL
jgi:ABC-2 type transport system permease protein